MWQWRTKRPVKSRKRERNVTLPFRGTTTVSRQSRSVSFSPLIATNLEGIGMDVKYMVVGMLVDDGPFLDRAERDALIDAIRIENLAADQVRELLVIGGGWKFGLLDR